MKINNTLKHPRWYDIHCCCGVTTEDKHPIKECLHCKFEQAESSLPKEDFKVDCSIYDEKTGEILEKKSRTVTEVTIFRGSKFEDVIGWFY